MVPVGRLIVLRVYPKERLINVMSFITMPGLAGNMLGPTLGGFLVEYASWHWIFLINLPIGIVGVLMTRAFMPDVRIGGSDRFDWPGFLLFSLSICIVTVGLEGVDDIGLSLGTFATLLVAGLGGQIVYWKYFSCREGAILHSHAFRTRRFSVGIAANIMTRLGVSAIPFINPLFMQMVLGYSAIKTGIVMVPLALTSLMAKPLAAPLLKRLGFRRLLFVNTVFQGVLIATLSLFSLDESVVALLVHLSLLGGVNAIQFSTINTFTLVDLPPEDGASGNSMLSVVMQLAYSLAVGIATFILYSYMPMTGADAITTLRAFHRTYLILGVGTMIASAVFLLAPKDKIN